MNEKTIDRNAQVYLRPKRFFEDSGTVYPDASYYVQLENVVNTKNQEKIMGQANLP